MNYEKKYKETLKKIENLRGYSLECNNMIDELFPELKESEDERIRKALLNEFIHLQSKGYKFAGLEGEDILAWLEKQGVEELPFGLKTIGESLGFTTQDECDKYHQIVSDCIVSDKAKFKVGDWIVNKQNEIARINEVKKDSYGTQRYYIEFIDGTKTNIFSCFAYEDGFQLWTIQDAKDGNVLVADDNEPFIFKGLLDAKHPNYPVAYCGLDSEDYFIVSRSNIWWTDEYVKPATKEQRELLFSKMKEAGYEWDTEKKELKKIEKIDEKYKVGEYFTGLIPCWVNAPSTQQPAHNYHGKNIIAIHLKDGGYRCCCIDDKKPVTFSLPENTPLVEGWKRKSVEWSDDDEKMMQCIHKYIRASASNFDYENIQIWFRNIKNRVQSHWKPTDEQMRALSMAYKDSLTSGENLITQTETLKSLYNELKKL